MANRYWVGGTETWDATAGTKWATTSGGAGGASVPGAADNAYFDANSGAITVTLGVSPNVSVVSFSGFTGTFDFNSYELNLGNSGGTAFNSGTTIAGFGGVPIVNLTYSGSTGTRTIRMENLGESKAVSFNITNGSDTISLTASNGAYKNLNLTGFTGSVTLTGSIICYGNLTIPAGITFSSVTASMSFRATSGTQIVTTNNVTFDFPININAAGATIQFADALTQNSTRSFVFTAGTVKLKAGVTSTVGTFSTSGTTQKYLQSDTADSQATLSQASGTVNAQFMDIKDIAATGGATWNAINGSLNKGNNSGWYFSHQMGNLSPALGW